MKLKSFVALLIPLLLSTGSLFATYIQDCANDEPPCDEEEVGCCGEETGGTNPVSLYRASLSRRVTDLRTFGAAPIEFTRIYQSRTLTFNTAYWDFGMNEGWQHNWNFEMRQLSSKTFNFFDIKIRYPNGFERNFQATDNTGLELAPAAGSGDRLYRWSGSPVGYTLVRRDGSQYDFLRYSSPKFDLKEVRNGLGFQWVVTHDVNHKVKRITNNFGRWIEIDRGLVGGVEVITKVKTDDAREVTFGYTTWTPTSEQTLTSATYPGGEQAAYTWVGADSLTTGRPLLGTADDPMYPGGGARTKYVYNYDFIFDFGNGPYLVTGIIKEERNKDTDAVIISLPGGAGHYPEIREGNGTEITRKFTNARLTESRDGEGRITTYTYDSGGFGYRATIVTPNGGTTSYTRDYAGRPLSITDALGNVENWTYSAAGFQLTHTNKRNYTTTLTRDTDNRVTRKDYPDSTYEEWTYDTNGLVLTHRLRNTGTAAYTYHATGNVATHTDTEGHTWTYAYDASGQPTAITDPRSNTTSYVYDWRGKLLSITHPDTTGRVFEYDDYGNLVKVTDELSKITEFTYNEYNRLSEIKDPLNRVTQYEYGREPGCSSCGFSASVTKITLPSGKETENTYDLSWKLLTSTVAPGTADEATTTYGYNAAGDLESVTNPKNEVVTFTYDLLHRRLTATDPLNHTTTWTYDATSNKITEQLADTTVSAFEYDAMNRLVKTTDALSQVTEMTYGGNDSLLTLKDARNNTYTFEYDLRDLKTKMIYPGASYEAWSYNEVGSVSSHRTRAGWVKTCVYDSRNRDVSCSWNDGWTPAVSRTYDAVGRVLTINNPYSELTYTYDAAGQLTREAQKIMDLNSTKNVYYTYTLDGDRAKITHPNGRAFEYTYNERRQVVDISLYGALINPLVHYDYNVAGERTKRTLNNFTETDYQYDSDGRPVEVKHSNAAGVFDKRNYGYNSVNNRTWEKRDSLLGDAYSYDAVGQITGVQYDATNPDSTPSSPAKTEAFTYDATGNWATYVGSGTATLSANNLNQYTGHVFNGSAQPIHYDSDGNMSVISFFDGANRVFTYDGEGRLGYVEDGPALTAFLYDGRNRCVGKFHSNGSVTYYAYDGWNVIAEYDVNGNHVALTAHGVWTDEPILRWAAGNILSYYHQDALGNVTRLTDTSGVVVEKYSYDVYGKPKIFDALNQPRTTSFFGNKMMFTGRLWDEEIRLYDYRNRFYTPELGRFLQTDPIRFEAKDVNLYRYVSNNPKNLVDPTGTVLLSLVTDIVADQLERHMQDCQEKAQSLEDCKKCCKNTGFGIDIVNAVGFTGDLVESAAVGAVNPVLGGADALASLGKFGYNGVMNGLDTKQCVCDCEKKFGGK
jgi:RHS repeat-associated protein